MLNVALPKGRLGEKVYARFAEAGYPCPSVLENSRKLIFENSDCGVRYFWVKPSDVAIYVERGAADIGVAGKDILLEYTPAVYELARSGRGQMPHGGRGQARFPLQHRAHPAGSDQVSEHLLRAYYASKSREIELIHLNGSIELAPILGMSDVIVDIVETGTTLKENDLEPIARHCAHQRAADCQPRQLPVCAGEAGRAQRGVDHGEVRSWGFAPPPHPRGLFSKSPLGTFKNFHTM